MSKYECAELLRKWKLEEISPKQAIGQLLLWTKDTVQKMRSLQSSVSSLKGDGSRAALVTQVERLEQRQSRCSVEEELEFDALKHEQAKLSERVDRLAQRVEGIVMREIRRHEE